MVKIDKEKCIGCSLCSSICPEAFELNSEGKAEVKTSEAPCIKEAISSCPVEALTE